MAVNKLALIRYKTIDECLRNRFRKWTLDDLIKKVSDVLYDYEGITNGVSRRTIQGDIQLMRSDKLGYNAPIVVTDRKYYSYEDPQYSITMVPINDADVAKMKEIVGVLKQFEGFNYFEDLSEIITRLESSLNKSVKSLRNHIQFESNAQLKGIRHINPLYRAILNKRALYIDYQSFKAKEPHRNIYYPYLLKEYRNRWFLIARAKNSSSLLTMALDRIVEFQELMFEPYEEYTGVDFDRYYSDLIGVSKSEKDRPHKVILQINRQHAPYVLAKPVHHSQQLLKEDVDGIIIRIDVVLNFELEQEILGLGENIKVLAPRLLQKQIKQRLKVMKELYK